MAPRSTFAAAQGLLAGVRPQHTAVDSVDVWAWQLDADADAIAAARSLLGEDERNRADRFVNANDRSRYVVAHGVMRSVLAAYVGEEASRLRFTRGRHAKPALAEDAARVRFNLAHSGDRAMLAVSTAHEVGIDVERERDDVDPLAIAERYFFDADRDAIYAAPPALRMATFVRLWVAKEALLKAHGTGLWLPLDAFTIEFAADGTRAHALPRGDNGLAPGWKLRMLELDTGWHGAVAAAGDAWTLRLRT